MSVRPIISVIIPTYNRVQFICETLDSIKGQTFSNWECIIVDDGSTDNTSNVIATYLEDDRIQFHKRPASKPKGANSCRNHGLSLSQGTYIHWMDSDDILHHDCYALCLEIFKTEKIDFCSYKRTLFFGEIDKSQLENAKTAKITSKIDSATIEAVLKNEVSLNTCNVIWDKAAIGNQGFNETIVYADEWEFYTRLLTLGLKGVKLDATLLYGRKHADSTTYEFSQQDSKRLQSKKKAIILVAENLKEKDMLSTSIHQYLINQAVGFRDFLLLKKLLKIKSLNTVKQYVIYVSYPLWKLLKTKFK